jgi:hypothetical protein
MDREKVNRVFMWTQHILLQKSWTLLAWMRPDIITGILLLISSIMCKHLGKWKLDISQAMFINIFMSCHVWCSWAFKLFLIWSQPNWSFAYNNYSYSCLIIKGKACFWPFELTQ